MVPQAHVEWGAEPVALFQSNSSTFIDELDSAGCPTLAVLEAPWPPVESYTENPTCWPRDSRVVSAPRSLLSRYTFLSFARATIARVAEQATVRGELRVLAMEFGRSRLRRELHHLVRELLTSYFEPGIPAMVSADTLAFRWMSLKVLVATQF
jgi:hypothetical protein